MHALRGAFRGCQVELAKAGRPPVPALLSAYHAGVAELLGHSPAPAAEGQQPGRKRGGVFSRQVAGARQENIQELKGADAAGPLGETLRRIAQSLRADSFQHMLEALGAIEKCRREDQAGGAALDHLEAEALRQYGRHQAAAGRLVLAINEYMRRAIHLDPDRADLYVERAQYRLQHYCPDLARGVLSSEVARSEAAMAVADCEEALNRDPSLGAAYELALPVLLVQGNLAAAEHLSDRGEALVSDPVRSTRLGKERDHIRDFRADLEEAERLLAAEEKQPAEVENIVSALRSRVGPRLEAALRKQLDSLGQRAATQRHFQDSRSDRAEVRWAAAWGGLMRT